MKNLRPLVAPLLLTCALACCLIREARAQGASPQEVVKDGVRIEFTIEPAGQAGAVTAGRDAVVRFRVSDAATKAPLAGARPSAWASLREGDGAQGGVTVLDASALKVAAAIQTGAGAHEVAFSGDGRLAFVTNGAAGTLSVIDASRLTKLKDVKVGARPVSVAYSGAARAAYVAGEDGQITAVGGADHAVVATLRARPGLRSVRFAPGGRYGFAPNAAESAVHIFDATTNQLLHSPAVGSGPDQVTFTNAFAYVRSAGSGEVSTVRLGTPGRQPDVIKFPGGQAAPNAEPTYAASSDAIAPAPEGNAVLVANPGDKQIYYYSEGMAAPMGSFQNYRRVPRAVRVVDRGLREESRGVYATTVKLPKAGKYDVAFLLDSPRVIHCFEAEAAPDPDLKEAPKAGLRLEYLDALKQIRAGQPFKLRFKLTEAATGQPADDLKDVRVLFFRAPGVWQKRDLAQGVGQGIYELTLTPPEPGVYMIFVESISKGVNFRQLPSLTLQAAAPGATKE